MLHIDLWGPYRTKSTTGCSQFLIIVDDYTWFTWIHLLKFKSEVPAILESFYQYVQNQFKTSIVFFVCCEKVKIFEILNAHTVFPSFH